ncbi:hypothetical protein NFI96_002250 [Prochilodus magdalenae]|nr:hypothetical protein NFI96_002250 [Prochilodus magdalenae]
MKVKNPLSIPLRSNKALMMRINQQWSFGLQPDPAPAQLQLCHCFLDIGLQNLLILIGIHASLNFNKIPSPCTGHTAPQHDGTTTKFYLELDWAMFDRAMTTFILFTMVVELDWAMFDRVITTIIPFTMVVELDWAMTTITPLTMVVELDWAMFDWAMTYYTFHTGTGAVDWVCVCVFACVDEEKGRELEWKYKGGVSKKVASEWKHQVGVSNKVSSECKYKAGVSNEVASEWKHKVGVSNKVASEWKHQLGVSNKVSSECKYKAGVSKKVASEWKHKVSISNKVASEWKHQVGVSNKVSIEWKQQVGVSNKVASECKYKAGVSNKVASEWKHKVSISNKVASEWKQQVGVSNKVASAWKHQVGVSNKVASEWKHKVSISNKVASEWKQQVGVSNKVASKFKYKAAVSNKVASVWKHQVGVSNKMACEWKHQVGVSNKVASEWKHQVGVSNKVATQRITLLPTRKPPTTMWETGVRIPVWVTTLCYTNKSPWARLLTLHWPTCKRLTLCASKTCTNNLSSFELCVRINPILLYLPSSRCSFGSRGLEVREPALCQEGHLVQFPELTASSFKYSLTQPAIPKTHGSQVSRLFSVLARRWWNELPLAVRAAESLPVFKSRLKTHLFVMHLSMSTGLGLPAAFALHRHYSGVSKGMVPPSGLLRNDASKTRWWESQSQCSMGEGCMMLNGCDGIAWQDWRLYARIFVRGIKGLVEALTLSGAKALQDRPGSKVQRCLGGGRFFSRPGPEPDL